MKKILLFLTLFVTSISVSAKGVSAYYSDYGKWSEYSAESINETELIEVEVERRYKWYKVETTGEYLLYGDGINKYENISLDNYQETNYSDWSVEKPKEEKDRVIESEMRYAVKKVKPIKYIYILGGKFTKEGVNLNKIEIYNNNKLVNFTSICSECSGEYIFDDSNSMLIIELDDYYYFDDLNIVITPINNNEIQLLNFMITAPTEDGDGEKIYYIFSYKNNNEDRILFNVKNVDVAYPEYEKEKIYKTLPDISYSDVVQELTFYRYKDRLYYFYDNVLNYVNGYFKEYAEYIKDDDDYLDYFRYRIRDKIELSDYIEIKSRDDHIENYITSTVQYQLNGNIDYDKNGIYIINVKTYFVSKDIPVLVNIADNDKKDTVIVEKKDQNLIDNYNKLEKDYNKLKDEQRELLNNYEDVVEERNNLKNEKNNIFINYQTIKNKYDKLLNTENDINSLEENKCKEELEKVMLKNDDNEKKLKLTNQAYDYLKSSLLKIDKNDFEFGFNWYLLLILLLILIGLLIINIVKKRKNKNKF